MQPLKSSIAFPFRILRRILLSILKAGTYTFISGISCISVIFELLIEDLMLTMYAFSHLTLKITSFILDRMLTIT